MQGSGGIRAHCVTGVRLLKQVELTPENPEKEEENGRSSDLEHRALE
jgi:hypothetical protein